MKNIAVSIDAELYQRACIRAAEMNTSVSALIKAFLVQLTNEGADWERRKRLECEVIASIEAFSAADRLSRDEVNDRRLVYSEHLSAGRDYAGVRVINPFL